MRGTILATSNPRVADRFSTRVATEFAQGLQIRLGCQMEVRELAANPPLRISPADTHGRIASRETRTQEEGTVPGPDAVKAAITEAEAAIPASLAKAA